ncbi:thiamine pyrophosphate-requiring protein [Propylenella binzhouense]|uniref:Thiamine pyrophosphate-requiring protein n=1 Tax=Propylenella binzhouense TaxID=2555902 RepID=A0A964T7T6_9HYPH|nr:thiamine pyrophosphate-requiring protein [Propylenella binzhouense]MYZ50141.1 thiamine pyrophosphate-requiring protein [Propylenella binzhouense]
MKHTRPEGSFAAEAVLGHMKAAGIDVIFANGGTDFPSIIEAFARSAESGIAMPEPMIVPHEGVAVGMAHGYYLMSGRPAGVMVHVNVGLANSVMGLVNAASENVPVLMCSGRTPLTEKGRFGSRSSPIHWGQEMRDQAGMIREIVKWDYELRYPEQAGPAIDRAISIAMSEPRGPVYLSLPREALAEPVRDGGRPPVLAPTLYGPPRAEAVGKAADLLAAAERPLLIVQSAEIGEDFGPLARFAERYALPVAEYWSTRLALPTTHPMHVGREPADLVRDADVIVVLNAMVPWIPDHVELAPGCRVIAIGPDPQFRAVPMRGFELDVSLAGGTNEGLSALAEAMAARVPADADFAERRARIAALKEAQAAAVEKRVGLGGGAPMNPAFVSRCISDAMGERATLFNELGVDPAAMAFTAPRSYFANPLSGGLGWGVPAALGALVADRSRQVIAAVGDGSYMFANPVACHQTAAALGLPLLTVVFNNGIWNAVRRATVYMYPDGSAATANVMPITALSPAPDYAAVARAHGAHAERVEDGAALPGALARALAETRSGRQALLEVVVSY